MATVKFISIDGQARTATFDVEGEMVTRKIPLEFSGTIDEYLSALARGLAIEFQPKTVTEIGTPSFSAGQEL